MYMHMHRLIQRVSEYWTSARSRTCNNVRQIVGIRARALILALAFHGARRSCLRSTSVLRAKFQPLRIRGAGHRLAHRGAVRGVCLWCARRFAKRCKDRQQRRRQRER